MLDLLLRSPARDASAVSLQQALVEWDAVGPDEADLLVTRLPGQVEIRPEIAEVVAVQLMREAENPSEHTLDVLAGLDRHGIRLAPGPLADLLEADRDVNAFLEATRTNEFVVDQRYFQGTVARLGRAAPAVVKLRLESVLDACLECRHPYVGGEVLIVLDSGKSRTGLAKALIERWKQRLLRRPDDFGTVIWGVSCLDYPELPGRRHDQIAAALRECRDTLSPAAQKKWFQEVQHHLQPAQRESWAEVAGQDAGKPRVNLWRSRDGGRS